MMGIEFDLEADDAAPTEIRFFDSEDRLREADEANRLQMRRRLRRLAQSPVPILREIGNILNVPRSPMFRDLLGLGVGGSLVGLRASRALGRMGAPKEEDSIGKKRLKKLPEAIGGVWSYFLIRRLEGINHDRSQLAIGFILGHLQEIIAAAGVVEGDYIDTRSWAPQSKDAPKDWRQETLGYAQPGVEPGGAYAALAYAAACFAPWSDARAWTSPDAPESREPEISSVRQQQLLEAVRFVLALFSAHPEKKKRLRRDGETPGGIHSLLAMAEMIGYMGGYQDYNGTELTRRARVLSGADWLWQRGDAAARWLKRNWRITLEEPSPPPGLDQAAPSPSVFAKVLARQEELRGRMASERYQFIGALSALFHDLGEDCGALDLRLEACEDGLKMTIAADQVYPDFTIPESLRPLLSGTEEGAKGPALMRQLLAGESFSQIRLPEAEAGGIGGRSGILIPMLREDAERVVLLTDLVTQPEEHSGMANRTHQGIAAGAPVQDAGLHGEVIREHTRRIRELPIIRTMLQCEAITEVEFEETVTKYLDFFLRVEMVRYKYEDGALLMQIALMIKSADRSPNIVSYDVDPDNPKAKQPKDLVKKMIETILWLNMSNDYLAHPFGVEQDRGTYSDMLRGASGLDRFAVGLLPDLLNLSRNRTINFIDFFSLAVDIMLGASREEAEQRLRPWVKYVEAGQPD